LIGTAVVRGIPLLIATVSYDTVGVKHATPLANTESYDRYCRECLLTAGWDQVREELLRLARHRGCRSTVWSRSIPCDWSPQTVWDPRLEMYFTSEGAWSLIIELLESGRQFTAKPMSEPPDTIAYEIVLRLAPSVPELYIKVQVYKGKVLGRSFHNSTR
jgi:hypothetical protein